MSGSLSLELRPERLVEVRQRESCGPATSARAVLSRLQLLEHVVRRRPRLRPRPRSTSASSSAPPRSARAAPPPRALSSRSPRKLGARRWPSLVHWANFTRATSSGFTQVIGAPSAVRSASSLASVHRRTATSSVVERVELRLQLDAASGRRSRCRRCRRRRACRPRRTARAAASRTCPSARPRRPVAADDELVLRACP